MQPTTATASAATAATASLIGPAPAGGVRTAIRRLIRASHTASLATTHLGESRPYASLVTVASDFDGAPLLLLSKLADHTRNIEADPRVALLFDGTHGFANPQQGPRVTVMAVAERDSDPRIRQRFLARHPGAALYADFPDFAFFRLRPERAHWVGGFARAVWVDDGLLLDQSSAAAFAAAEQDVLRHMNGDHAETVTLMARRLLKLRGKGWAMTAVDPDGCDLTRGDRVARLPFDQALTDVSQLRGALMDLAARTKNDNTETA